jgi:multiple antibiotic resistance protein
MMRDRKNEAVIVVSGTAIMASIIYYAFAATGQALGLDGRALGSLWQALAFDGAEFWTFFAALFAIMNPLIALPLFISMTEERPVSARNRLALVTSITVLIALIVACALGQQLLGFFAISIGSFRIAGGIIVLLMGLAMMRPNGVPEQANQDRAQNTDRRDSQAICPLAIPLLAGPGGIATIILYSQGADQTSDYAMIAVVIALMAGLTYATLRLARPIARVLGDTGLMVLGRLIGMIVSAIAIDMMVIGLRHCFPGIV